ncbi:uncharacterized protein IL334_002673 [Kwoniella shivajii]|uniref:Uncharacterized protein n=1 Tax=Kwoniella shivajii TaxID=564305 RepID=A0ABZ1CVD7_9TREE|nr:hypothetical protein IL334_002673 [Kwoniella shivajii]
MDIIHRLNPFHRPASSLRNNTPTPTVTSTIGSSIRPSSSLESGSAHPSIDSTLIPTSYDGAEIRYDTPASPIKGHYRTPSILRSLAHHPSLSALKNKSKKKKRVRGAFVPPLPLGEYDKHEIDEQGKVKQNGLKFSKSLPRDMRLSHDPQVDSLPPVPPHPLVPTSSHNLTYPRTRSISPDKDEQSSNSIKRIPPPSPNPQDYLNANISIDYDHFPTPESMRMKMRFDSDLTQTFNGTSKTHLESQSVNANSIDQRNGLGVESPRRRYMSFDQRLSPRKAKIRHLSTPSESPPRRPHPQTTQHPHPIPMQSHLYAQSLYAESSTFFSPDFGAPPPQPFDWDSQQVDDDGLDTFIDNHQLPPGTPGGRREVSQRGACAHGVEHNKDAVRLFSRDTYPHPSPSPESTPPKSSPERYESTPTRTPKHRRSESSPACSPVRKQKEAFKKAAKRSSSPFEVKLSANVTKRMSLDAFGTPSPPRSVEEEVVEEVLSESHEDEHDNADQAELDQLRDNGLEGYQSHELSNITESPSSAEHSFGNDMTQTPSNPTSAHGTTPFFTPLSPTLTHQELPLPMSHSPLTWKNHMSAPPLVVTTSLLAAQEQHSSGLKDQLKAREMMMDILYSEVNELRAFVNQYETEKELLHNDLLNKEEEIEEWEERCEGKDTALDQLRQAIRENEEHFEILQDTHDSLAERCAHLEQEKCLLQDSMLEVIANNGKMKSDLADMRVQMNACKDREGDIEREKKGLEVVVLELRREMRWAEEQDAERDKLVKYAEERELEVFNKDQDLIQQQMKEKDCQIVMLEKQISDAHHGYQETIATLKDNIEEISNQLIERTGIFSKSQGELSRLRQDLDCEQSERRSNELDLREQDFTITSLREELVSSRSSIDSLNLFLKEKDEKIDTLIFDVSVLRDQVKCLKAENISKDATISVLKDKVELARFETNECRFESEVELNQLREQMEELTRSSAEREWAGRQGTEMIARLMEEKREWEEERDELVEMINRNSIDEESSARLRDQIDSLTSQLNTMSHHVESIQSELEDRSSALAHKTTLIHAQEAELSALRLTVSQSEDTLSSTRQSLERQSKEQEKIISRLREEVETLGMKLKSHDNALRSAVVEAESTKVNYNDYNSRLSAYLKEIDQLRLSEKKLQSSLSMYQRESSDQIMKFSEMNRKLKALEDDKELLNVALESKILELTLLQRSSNHTKSRTNTVTPVPSHLSTPSFSTTSRHSISSRPSTIKPSMSMSTSKIPSTPTPSTGDNHLPRRLTTSTSATTRSRRDTISNITIGTTTPRIPLGSSTRHNKVQLHPEMRAGLGVTGDIKKVERRTSLPVLTRRPSSVIGHSANGKRDSLLRVDEVSRVA